MTASSGELRSLRGPLLYKSSHVLLELTVVEVSVDRKASTDWVSGGHGLHRRGVLLDEVATSLATSAYLIV